MKRMKKKELLVLSLGGSIVVPDGIDSAFLKKFVVFIKRNLRRFRFIIVVGGGRTCRIYQNVARELAVRSQTELDWVGIAATRLNAELLRAIFGKLAEKKVMINFQKPPLFKRPIMIAAGDAPGSSSDEDAVAAARLYGAKKIINLSNIDYAYTRDPKKFPDALPIKNLSWQDFSKLVGSKWVPGKNSPFDPVASRYAKKYGLEVIIVNGRNLSNLQRVLEGKSFRGTKIVG